MAHPHPRPSCPLPTSASLCSGSCPGHVYGRMEVGGGSDTCDIWWSECLGKPAKPRPWVWVFSGWLWVDPYPYLSHPYPGTRAGLQIHDRPYLPPVPAVVVTYQMTWAIWQVATRCCGSWLPDNTNHLVSSYQDGMVVNYHMTRAIWWAATKMPW